MKRLYKRLCIVFFTVIGIGTLISTSLNTGYTDQDDVMKVQGRWKPARETDHNVIDVKR